MNDDLKNGLLVSGLAVVLYLIYTQAKKSDVIVIKKEEPMPKPVETVLI